jgi:hypothetical protein
MLEFIYTFRETCKLSYILTSQSELEQETVKWCRQILRNNPMAIRVLKSALNAAEDDHAGLQVKPAKMLTLPLEVGTAAGELLSACCITDVYASALGAWRECHAYILRHGGGKGREERVHGETTPRFLQVPTQTLSFSSLLNWPIHYFTPIRNCLLWILWGFWTWDYWVDMRTTMVMCVF